MKRSLRLTALLATTALAGAHYACAGQVPAAASDPDIPISHRDRVYSAEQYSNTVSVTDPASNTLVGAIRLGDPLPANLSPLYRGQLLVHGLGFSPDHRTIAVVAIGSNAVNFIDTASNAVKHVTYLGRSPHEAFFTPDGKEVWVVVRGENYVAVLDGYEQVVLRIVPGSNPLRVVNPPGQRTPALATSNGRAMLARLSDQEIRARVPAPYPKLPRNSPQNFKQLMARLDDIRRSGNSEASDEAIEGVGSQGFALASGETGELIGIAVSYSVQATTAAERANVRRELSAMAAKLRRMTSDPLGQAAKPQRMGTA